MSKTALEVLPPAWGERPIGGDGTKLQDEWPRTEEWIRNILDAQMWQALYARPPVKLFAPKSLVSLSLGNRSSRVLSSTAVRPPRDP